MLIVNVLPFVILVVLVVGAEPSNEDSEYQSKSTRDYRRQLSVRAVNPAVTTFFAGGRRPEGIPNSPAGVEIAQSLPADHAGTPPYFVTLFNRIRNIPLYSAYKVTPIQAASIGTQKRPDVDWRNPKDDRGQGIPVEAAYKEAINTDKQPLSRGHLNPSGINSFDENFMRATFTLTNAAPQFTSSNSGPWEDYEERVRQYAKCPCGSVRGGTLYLLTGISDHGLTIDADGNPVQDNRRLPRVKNKFLNGGVRLDTPRALWTAGCCVWREPGKIFGTKWQSDRAESFAVMTNNRDDPTLLHQTEMSVVQLEELLTPPGSPRVNLFPGNARCRNPNNPDFTLPL